MAVLNSQTPGPNDSRCTPSALTHRVLRIRAGRNTRDTRKVGGAPETLASVELKAGWDPLARSARPPRSPHRTATTTLRIGRAAVSTFNRYEPLTAPATSAYTQGSLKKYDTRLNGAQKKAVKDATKKTKSDVRTFPTRLMPANQKKKR